MSHIDVPSDSPKVMVKFSLVERVDLGEHQFYLDIAIVLNKQKSLKPEIRDFVDCFISTKKDIPVVLRG